MMLRHNGGDKVKAGFYFNMDSWEVTTLSGQGGQLAGDESARYLRLPLPMLLVFAPLMGAAFAMFLPFIGIAMVINHFARKAWQAGREMFHSTAMAVGPREATGAAYFTGDAAKKDESAKDAAVEARLKDLEREIEQHEQK